MKDRNSAGKTSARSMIWDLLILAAVGFAVYYIRQTAIPYINTVYHYSASSINLGYGASDLLTAMLRVNPSEWFQTRLYSFDLPSYKWYTAVLLAVTVQVMVRDIASYLELSWLRRFGALIGNVLRVGISLLFTNLMMALITLALMTVCPQNVKLLFLLLEMALFCLPALIHFLASGRKTFSFAELMMSLLSVAVLYLTVDKAFLGSIILFVINYIMNRVQEKKSVDRFEKSSQDDGMKWYSAFGAAGAAAWIIGVGLIMQPFVELHMPTVEFSHEDIHVSSITARNYDAWFIRTNGAAINRNNEVYVEDVSQIAVCSSNKFFLKDDGQVVVCREPGGEAALLMDGVSFIASYDDVLIAIDRAGDLWGFGDLTAYVPGGAYSAEPVKILEGRNLVKADIGSGHILMIDGAGDLYGMGENLSGELGNGSTSIEVEGFRHILSGIADAKAGLGVSYALTLDGRVYVWGRNDKGQLGTDIHVRPFKIGSGYAINDGSATVLSPVALDISDEPIRQISIGAECGYAVDEENRLWNWGSDGMLRDNISGPVMVRDNIVWIADNKYQSGTVSQRNYYIKTDGEAYQDTPGNRTNYEEDTAELVFDASNWFPEPIEIVNSRLESLMDRLGIFTADDVPEEATVDTKDFGIRAPRDDRGVHAYQHFDGHTYRMFDEYLNADIAEQICEGMGGHLVTITSREEHDFVAKMVSRGGSSFYCIGLKYDDGFYWMTGETTSYIDSLGIKAAFDNPRGEGYINASGKLNVGMMVEHFFICEWDY